MPLRRFLPYDVLAAGAVGDRRSASLGYVFWRSIDKLTTYVSRGLFAFGTLVVVVGGIVALVHLRRNPEARAKVRDVASTSATTGRAGARSRGSPRPVWRMVAQPGRRRSPTSPPASTPPAHARATSASS